MPAPGDVAAPAKPRQAAKASARATQPAKPQTAGRTHKTAF